MDLAMRSEDNAKQVFDRVFKKLGGRLPVLPGGSSRLSNLLTWYQKRCRVALPDPSFYFDYVNNQRVNACAAADGDFKLIGFNVGTPVAFLKLYETLLQRPGWGSLPFCAMPRYLLSLFYYYHFGKCNTGEFGKQVISDSRRSEGFLVIQSAAGPNSISTFWIVLGVLTFVVLLFVVGLVPLAVGYALQKRKRWAKPLGLALAVFSLINIPVGTALGIYTIKFFRSEGGVRLYGGKFSAASEGDLQDALNRTRPLMNWADRSK